MFDGPIDDRQSYSFTQFCDFSEMCEKKARDWLISHEVPIVLLKRGRPLVPGRAFNILMNEIARPWQPKERKNAAAVN